MDKKIDNIISQLEKLKTSSKKTGISKTILKKWDDSCTISELKKNTTLAELRELCTHFELEEKGEKKKLANRLWEYWESLDSDSDDSGEDDSEDSDSDDSDSDDSDDEE